MKTRRVHDADMKAILEIFVRFLLLGLTSFGGPAAHIGYFRRLFVDELKWVDEAHFARLIALSQFLPGPGSSQLGFAIGLHRGGVSGAVAAFLGFTLPSFLIMLALSLSGNWLSSQPWVDGIVHGLKLLAVVVVADATLSMYRTFCHEVRTAAITVIAAVVLLTIGGIHTQLVVLLAAALAGMAMLQAEPRTDTAPFRPRLLPLLLFLALLGLTLAGNVDALLAIAGDFYLTGSIVFGGGHVVLPILEDLVANDLGEDTFLTGYAAAQAVPGPMFTLATFLGAELFTTAPVAGAVVATVAIFLPGFLLILAFIESWHRLAQQKLVSGAVAGINAAVVGLLLAALYDPVIVSAIESNIDVAVAVAAFFALRMLKLNIALLVLCLAFTGLLLQLAL